MILEEDTNALDNKLNNDLLNSYLNFIGTNNKSITSIVCLLAAISYFIIHKIYHKVEEETLNNDYNELNILAYSDMIYNNIQNKQEYEYIFISLDKAMVTYNSYDENLYSYINTDSILKSTALGIYYESSKQKAILNSEIEFYKYTDYEYEFSSTKRRATNIYTN